MLSSSPSTPPADGGWPPERPPVGPAIRAGQVTLAAGALALAYLAGSRGGGDAGSFAALLGAAAALYGAWWLGRRTAQHRLDELAGAARDGDRRAQVAERQRRDFLTNISHELRTPVAGVLGLVEILQREGVSDAQARSLRMIQDSTEGLLAIIDDLLDFGRVSAGTLRLDERRLDLGRLVEQTIGLMAPRAVAKDLDITYRLDPELPRFLVLDGTRVRQVLLNLLSNALKFTERGGVTVRVRWDAAAAAVTLEVEDTGVGIPAADVPRLFAPFEQLDSSTSRRFGGTGLGLAICRSLVDLMGGTLGVETRRGEGSRFHCTLPTRIAGDEDPAAPAVESVGSLPGRRILVVEDDEVNRFVTTTKLETLGVQTTAADNGTEALALLDTQAFDAILMDCQMPDIDGYELTRRLRRGKGPNASTSVLALTAHTHPDERGRCLAAGMNDFLSKPVTTAELYRALAAWIGPPARARRGAP